jgi:hypothetical protein
MASINDLKKKAAALKKKNEAAIKERVEVARLEATIKRESSVGLLNAKVRLGVRNQETEKLQQLVEDCAGIIASVPIHNTKTRSERVWAGNHRFNYGTQIDLLYQLATGILYSCQEHKQLLMAHVPVNLELLEQFIKSFGTPSYYSRNHHVVVEAKPANIDELQASIAVLQSELDVIIDTQEITPENVAIEFIRAETTALQNYEGALEAISQADFVL